MKRHFLAFIALVLSAQLTFAVDQSYYSSINNKKDGELRSAITSLVYTKHTTALGYNWNFADMDIVNNEVLDMYSTCEWTVSTDQCGGYSGICGCYNREHTVPQSLFNEKSPQVGDRHHLFLTDGKVNGTRSNFAFGETNETNTWKGITNASNALGQLGKASYAYSSSVTVYEPDDQYKGDIARAIMYMAVRYATSNECRAYNASSGNEYPVTAWSSNEMFSGSLSTNYGLSDAAVLTFLKWHRADPVSAKEIARNTGVENAQHNRNPFVDYPILVEYLWGKYKGQKFALDNAVGSFECAFFAGESDGDKRINGTVSKAYYASLNCKSGSELRSALTVLLFNNHTQFVKYDNWSFNGDYDKDGNLLDIYSSCGHTRDAAHSYTCCCDGINREHVVCQSNFGGGSSKDQIPQYSDQHHLFPTDGRANGHRSDLPFGECSDGAHGTCNNSSTVKPEEGNLTCENHEYGRSGLSTFETALPSGGGKVYEVGDEYKGDIARAVLYMVVRYAESQYCRLPDGAVYTDDNTNLPTTTVVSDNLRTANEYPVTAWANTTKDKVGQMFSSNLNTNFGLSDYGKAILLKWHNQDKVSQKEIDRNDSIAKVQGNRNPFVDYPYLVEYLWGEHAGEAIDLNNLVGSFESAFEPGVSNGSKGGETPTPTTKYTITWSVKGETSSDQVAQGIRPTPPSVDDCSTTRVFRGWTTNSSYSGNGSDLMKVQADFPVASSAATYYAVFADKEGSGSGAAVGTVMWAETWTGTTTKSSPDDAATPSANYGKGTTVYNSGSVTYTQSANSVYCRNENTGGGTAPELLLTQSQTWTISNIPTGGASELSLTYTSNNSKSSVTCSTSGASVSGSSKAYTIKTGGAATIALTFSASGNTRLDDISLTVKTTNNAATYSNYSTQCSAVPQVMVTFHKNDGSSTTTTQQVPENTSTALNANPWSRTHFTFLGWATSASGEKVYNDGQNVTISAALDLYAVWKEDDKYTVKWHTAEGTTSVVYYTGSALALPSTPAACEADVRVFKGWTAQSGYKHATSAPSDLFTEASGTVTANADYYAVYADKEVEKEPILVTDTLTCVLINQSNYGDWTGKTSYTSAVYAGNTGGELKYIQMRASSNSGIVTTTSGGVVRRIELKWKSNTTSGRTIDVYGKKSAYSSAADLYSSEAATKGALLGSITYGTSVALDIKVDSTYIGLRSSGNALYVDTIAIVWKTGENVTTTYSNYSTKCTAKVTVTFHKNDGSDVTTTQEISEGKATALTANPWSRTHYTFEGWATSASGEKVYDDEQSVTIDADLELYALWTEEPQYTVTCYSNGDKVNEVKGYAGDEILISDPEACEGYTFVGWSTTTCPTEVTDKPATQVLTTIPDHDVTYYAIFSRQEDGGSSLTNDYKKITTSEELTTANYVIAAYYNDGNSNLYGALSTSWKDDYYLAPVTVTPNAQDIITTTDGTIIWNLTVVGDLASIYNETVGYLYVEKSTKGTSTYYDIKLGDNTSENKFTHSVTDGNWSFTSAVYTDRVLEFYADGARWAIYKSADAPIYLYKQVVEDGHTTYYVSSPSCSGAPTAVENAVDIFAPRKVLVGDKMYIFIGEHCYDVTGKRIR